MRFWIVVGLGVSMLLGGYAVDAAPVGYAAWRSMYVKPRLGTRPVVRGRSLGSMVDGVLLVHSATPGTVVVGDVVVWRAQLANRSVAASVESRVEAEYTSPAGVHVTQPAVTSLTILGDVTDVQLRLYVAPGCEFRAGVDEYAVGLYQGGEVPMDPVVRADTAGRTYLLVDHGTVPQGKVVCVRWTTLVVGINEAPDGNVVYLGEVLRAPPPPPF